MGRKLSRNQLIEHKNEALSKLDTYITSLIQNGDPKTQGKADKFSFWLEDWATFLAFEEHFSPSSLRRYKRGEIIKAHLGYNVGSEEGGLHYCVVIDKNNSKNSPTVTIIPLTSVKERTDIEHLYPGNIYLGNELFTNLNSKIASTEKKLLINIKDVIKEMDSLADDTPREVFTRLQNKLAVCKKEVNMLERMKSEVQKMKIGSIALVPQIRTISKIRIYDPKTNYDILSNVKLSNEKLDMIDNEVLNLFVGRKQ